MSDEGWETGSDPDDACAGGDGWETDSGGRGSDYDEVTLGSRVDMEQHLYGDEGAYLKYYEADPLFDPGEVEEMLKEASEESSFNDDVIPDSEKELFSSPWEEGDVGDYVPPITNKKKILLYKLMENRVQDEDSFREEYVKEQERDMALDEFKDYLLKKRAIRAYRRLQKLKDANLENPEQAAFFLEKLELIDKKLDRKFYYELVEPQTYKKLLRKRKKAVRRKYELYAVDSVYRKELHDRVTACVQNIFNPADISLPSTSVLAARAKELEKEEDESDGLSTTEPSEEEQSEEEAEEEEDEQSSEEDSISSFYDTAIPESEKEYFSSPIEEDTVPYPPPKSRRIFKYNRLLNACKPLPGDTRAEKQRKYLKKVDIMAQFKNFIERKRAVKLFANFKAIEHLGGEPDPEEEARHLIDMEIRDKKLHKDYYYRRGEPKKYGRILLKRRHAIIAKYEQYAKDPALQAKLKKKARVLFLRSQPAPLFEEIGGDDKMSDASSLNDTEIPTSEEEFMSSPEVKLPGYFKKPITRNKAALYKILEKYEPHYLDTEQITLDKRKARLAAIQNFKEQLIDRRRMKAIGRLDKVNKMGVQDPGIRANHLKKLELRDKKLNGSYYYMPKEPKKCTQLLQKRKRAIHRKYEAYVRDKEFRTKMEKRIRKQAYQKPKERKVPVFVDPEPEEDEENIIWDVNLDDMLERSMLLDERKLERRNENAWCGIWPQSRESAPPNLGRPRRRARNRREKDKVLEDLSLFYGPDEYEGQDREYMWNMMMINSYCQEMDPCCMADEINYSQSIE